LIRQNNTFPKANLLAFDAGFPAILKLSFVLPSLVDFLYLPVLEMMDVEIYTFPKHIKNMKEIMNVLPISHTFLELLHRFFRRSSLPYEKFPF